MTVNSSAAMVSILSSVLLFVGCTGSSRGTNGEVSGAAPLAPATFVSTRENSGSDGVGPTSRKPSPLPSDMRLIHTPEGFAWRTVNVADETPCCMCRAGTPLVLENRPRITPGRADICDADVAGLNGDINGLFALLLSTSKQVRDVALSNLVPWMDPTHNRLVHALLTHPRPEVRGSALELAGRSQLNMFMPELSQSCRLEDGPEKRGAVIGVHHLESIGGTALSREFPLPAEDNPKKNSPPEDLQAQCPPASEYRAVDSDRSVGSIAMGAFEHGKAGLSAEPNLDSAPPIVQFAYRAGYAVNRGEREKLETYTRLLTVLLERDNPCLVHPCDWQLLAAMKGSLLSLSGTTR